MLQNAEVSLGISPDASTIAAASKLLLDASIRRRQAVRLCWPYGGHRMEVAGDVLGGWHLRAPLQQQRSNAGCSTTIEVCFYAALYSAVATAGVVAGIYLLVCHCMTALLLRAACLLLRTL